MELVIGALVIGLLAFVGMAFKFMGEDEKRGKVVEDAKAKRISDLESELGQKDGELKKALAEAHRLEEELYKAKDESDIFKKDNAELTAKIKVLEKAKDEVADIRNEGKQKEMMLQQETVARQKLQGEMSLRDLELSKVKQELKAKTDMLEGLKGQYNELEAEVQRIRMAPKAVEPPKSVDPSKNLDLKNPAGAEPPKAAAPVKPVEPVKPPEALKPPEPVKPPQPVKPPETIKPPEPVKPTVPIKPPEVVKPPEPPKPPQPIKPPELVKPPAPVKPPEPPKPPETIKPPEPVKPPESPTAHTYDPEERPEERKIEPGIGFSKNVPSDTDFLKALPAQKPVDLASNIPEGTFKLTNVNKPVPAADDEKKDKSKSKRETLIPGFQPKDKEKPV